MGNPVADIEGRNFGSGLDASIPISVGHGNTQFVKEE